MTNKIAPELVGKTCIGLESNYPFASTTCRRPAKAIASDGQPYCGIHNMDTRKARAEAKREAEKAKHDEYEAVVLAAQAVALEPVRAAFALVSEELPGWTDKYHALARIERFIDQLVTGYGYNRIGAARIANAWADAGKNATALRRASPAD